MGTVLVLGALLLIPIVAGEPAAAQTITFTKVADTTTSIPGVGAIFRSFSSPSIDGNAVAFLGNDGPFFSGNDGIYIDVDGSLDVVANVSTQVPGGVSNFDSFDLDVSIEGTDVVFIGETLSPAGSGVYVSVDGVGFETVADTDTQVPGSQGFFSGFLDASLSGGDVAFSGTGPSGNGVYTDVGGPLRVIVDPTTMYPGGGTFPTFGNPTPSLDDGIVAFTSLNSDNSRSSVFNDVGGTLVIVADEDTPVPGGQGTFSRIGAEVATNQGSVAFSAGSESFSTSGIYTDAGGTLRERDLCRGRWNSPQDHRHHGPTRGRGGHEPRALEQRSRQWQPGHLPRHHRKPHGHLHRHGTGAGRRARHRVGSGGGRRAGLDPWAGAVSPKRLHYQGARAPNQHHHL
jgi:hypothetical protein